MDIAAATRDILARLDIAAMRRLFAETQPHLPQPRSDYEVQVMVHSARTQASTMLLRDRAYSHQWLLANALTSLLPNELRPKAERMDFKFAFGVGIRVKTADGDSAKQQLGRQMQSAMGHAVEEAFADNRTDGAHLRRVMDEARDRTLRAFGRPRINVKVGYNFAGLPSRVR